LHIIEFVSFYKLSNFVSFLVDRCIINTKPFAANFDLPEQKCSN
jgi:hypothetical protein